MHFSCFVRFIDTGQTTSIYIITILINTHPKVEEGYAGFIFYRKSKTPRGDKERGDRETEAPRGDAEAIDAEDPPAESEVQCIYIVYCDALIMH